MFWKKKHKAKDIEFEEELPLEQYSKEDINIIWEFGKPKDNIGKYKSKRLIELPYGIVKVDLVEYMKNNELEEGVKAVMECQHEDFNIKKFTIAEIIVFWKWLSKELEFIFNLETNYLSSEPEPEMLAAGINKLNEFGAIATIDQLANGDILKHAQIEKLPYLTVYQKLKLDKAKSEIQKKYTKIIEEKAKRR